MNNLKVLRKNKRLKQKDLAEFLGIAQNTYSYWENEKTAIDNKSLEKLSDFYNVSVDYILGHANTENKKEQGVSIPVLGKVAAGIPITAIEDVLDYEEISHEMAQTGEFFALEIKGNSMEPRIKEGDVVIVKQQPIVNNGDVAVVLVNGNEATIKQFYMYDYGVSLVAYNPAYPPQQFTPQQVNELPVTVIGKVVELRAKF